MAYQVVLQQERKPTDGNKQRRVWMLLYRLENGKRRRQVIGVVGDLSERAAKKKRSDKEIGLNKGTVRAAKPSSILLKDFLEDDRKRQAVKNKPQTISTDESRAGLILDVLGENVKLADVDGESVERIRQAARPAKGKQLAVSTLNSRLSSMRAAFNRAVKRELIDKNPFVGSVEGKSQSEPPRVFSHDEIDRMLEAAPSVWWRAFTLLGFTTGLRLGELLNLTWDDIDFEKRLVSVTAKRASNKNRNLLEFTCKSYRGRKVPLTPKTAEVLRELRPTMGLSAYVFLSLKRLADLQATYPAGHEIAPSKLVNNYLRTFKAIQVAANITELGSVHSMRASYGTHTAASVPMHELRRLMGHADINTTAKYYLAPSEDTAEKVRRVFADVG